MADDEINIPKEFIDYTYSYPMVRLTNMQKMQQKEWNNPETRAFIDKTMPNATDREKFAAIKQISDPIAEEASKADLMAARQKYRSQ